jgi:glycosyltransferase involved in cell wall biosynthesis
MSIEKEPSFAFLVLAYNHQDYILEHLESIKYLVLTHGAGIDVDLIINDDFSSDQTPRLVNQWLSINDKLFRHINTLYNSKNLGTCKSVNNMLSQMVADRCKLTAGDDVYSFENIFELTQHSQNIAMVSGRTLYILNGSLRNGWISNGMATSSQVIYKNNTLLHRFKHLSYNNAPNILYATECLLHPDVREYLGQFDVTEDWPLQVAIARQFPDCRFKLVDQVLVYYRRTAGSTYIVANQRFINDKIKMYDDLIKNEANTFERLRLANRKICFEKKNSWINKLFNIDFYIFILSYAFRIFEIYRESAIVNIRLTAHQDHYQKIKAAAQIVIKKLNAS